jgi:hypothetical protein
MKHIGNTNIPKIPKPSSPLKGVDDFILCLPTSPFLLKIWQTFPLFFATFLSFRTSEDLFCPLQPSSGGQLVLFLIQSLSL